VAREVVLLVDHSGSMNGPKWAAADWAVERFLAGLTEQDAFALGLFHNDTRWLANEPVKATAEAVRKAVKFLKANRDSGGTNLGIALEQALELPRRGDTLSRHVLILTDAEVTDGGRILRLADREADRPDRRRVSVLCIDAAPNAALASELAERGGGIARFLTSNPEENDVTTALDEVLEDWAAPVWSALALEVNRPDAEAAGRSVSLRAPGPAAAVDLGDLPAGRPVWVAGRVALRGAPLTFHVRGAGTDALAECTVDQAANVPGLKALFGAQRIRRLEYLMHSGLPAEELRTELDRLGYDVGATATGSKVYAENERKDATSLVRPLLVREALESSLPSAETAFVAVRSEAGRTVGDTVVVANALPAGWSGEFAGYVAGGGGGGFIGGAAFGLASPRTRGLTSVRNLGLQAPAAPPAAIPQKAISGSYDEAAVRGGGGKNTSIPIPAGRHPTGAGAVLFDSARDKIAPALPAAGRLTAVTVSFADKAVTADGVGANLRLLVFAGDMAEPRARVGLADVVRQGGSRPLNVRWKTGQHVRLTIEDPDGRWQSGVPALEITLQWEG
jgi:Ca-activated chloride channel family protein